MNTKISTEAALMALLTQLGDAEDSILDFLNDKDNSGATINTKWQLLRLHRAIRKVRNTI